MKASKTVWWVLGLGIGLRVLLWCFQTTPEGDDGMRYLSESVNMVRYGVFSTAAFFGTHGVPAPSAHDLPLWPGIMACVYWMTGSVRATQYIAGAINILLCGGAALLLISLFKSMPFSFTDKQTAIGVGVYLFMPESVMYSLFHMPDQLAVSLVILALWCYFRGVYRDNRYLIGATLAFAASIYAKPICIPLAGALIVALFALLKCSIWKRTGIVCASLLCIGLSLYPWTVRNKMAFGTSGLTSISGTNLYGCNWSRLMESLPSSSRDAEKKEMTTFEQTIKDDDLMLRSQKQGKFARQKILSHFPEYALFTLRKHPRMYAGTGTVAMFRYLGLERICDCLDGMWGSGDARGYAVTPDKPYTMSEKVIGAGVQIVSWFVLLAGYVLVFVGVVRGGAAVRRYGDNRVEHLLVYLCPILSLALLAIVIGPITATRYRFIMIPFFAILAGYSLMPKTVKHD